MRKGLSADPYSEELARRLMELHARSNCPDAVRGQFEELETALEEIECEPSEETAAFKERLVEGAMRDATYFTANRRSGI